MTRARRTDRRAGGDEITGPAEGRSRGGAARALLLGACASGVVAVVGTPAAAAPLDMPEARLVTIAGERVWVDVRSPEPLRVTRGSDGRERVTYPLGLTLDTTDGSRVDELIHRRSEDGAVEEYLVSLEEGSPGAREAARRRGKSSHAGNGTVIGSSTATINNASIFATAGWTRYSNGANNTYFWGAEEGQAQAQVKQSIQRLDHVQQYFRYAGNTTLPSWSPNGSQSVGACNSVTFSAGWNGFSASRTTTVCPESILGLKYSTSEFYARWSGWVGPNVVRGIGGAVIRQTPRGQSVGWSPLLQVRFCNNTLPQNCQIAQMPGT